MADKQSTALVERPAADIIAIAREEIKTPLQYAEKLRALEKVAFVIGPSALGALPGGYTVVPSVVVIDPSIDKTTGRGADVYHQRSIHKGKKGSKDESGEWVDGDPIEVSLNTHALKRILEARGVNLYPTKWLTDQMARYVWVAEAGGDVMGFDGRIRQLPVGTGSVDAQDGSADIGEWTPEAWKEKLALAEKQRAMTPPKEQWKIKPESINGWTADRVMQFRRFGRQIAETRAYNRLARNLGVRQVYTIAELASKPFIIMVPMFQYDITDPDVKRMLTAANLGARNLLYPGALNPTPQGEPLPVSHESGEAGGTFEGEVATEASEPVTTAPLPEDLQPVDPPAPPAEAVSKDLYKVESVGQRGDAATGIQYFAQARRLSDGVVATLYTPDAAVMRALHAASKDGLEREIPTESTNVRGKTYLQAIEVIGATVKL